ncbi:MAG: hypothetical protein ACTHKY_17000, partial [Ginsengibacter sp.]
MKQIQKFYSANFDNSGTDEDSDSSSSSTDTSSANTGASTSDDSSTNSNASADNTDSPTQNSQSGGTDNTDSEGFKLLDSGSWNNSTTLNYQGGQVMHFQVKNVNVLGTTLSINSNLGGNKSLIILPQQTGDIRFDCFGSEPMGWTFDVSTDSDAFIVAWQ